LRPSQLKRAAFAETDRPGKAKYPKSPRADPAITDEEANRATAAVCLWHDGLIRLFGDRDGTVFFCPIGGQYWRYQKPLYRKPLRYPPRGGI
jgi:hypothetical protein